MTIFFRKEIAMLIFLKDGKKHSNKEARAYMHIEKTSMSRITHNLLSRRLIEKERKGKESIFWIRKEGLKVIENFSSKMKTIPDGNTDFNLVSLKDGFPHCKLHGAMLRVSEKNRLYRCIQADHQSRCRAGCIIE